MKKDIKKIDKKNLKDHIKKYSLLALNIICYICTTIFVISLIVGACTPPKQSSKVENPVSTMILRDKPVYRAIGDLPINYYTSLNDISISSDFSINLVGNIYSSYYTYQNPTYLDIYNALYNDVFAGDSYYIKVDGEISYSINSTTYNATHLYIKRFGNNFNLGVCRIDNNNNEYASQGVVVWNSGQAVNIARPHIFVQLFSGNTKAYFYSSASNSLKQVYRFILYYYSVNSFRNMSLTLFDNPIYSLSLSFAEYYMNNNYLFYSTPLWEYIMSNANSLTDYVFELPIAQGGFSINGEYYTDMVAIVRSAYSTLSNGSRVNYYGFEPNTALADYLNSTNDAFKGYFFIESISLTNRDNPVGNLGFSLYSVPRGVNTIPGLNGYFYTFFQSGFVSPSYRYINCYYLSHRVLSDAYSVNILNNTSFINISLISSYFATSTPIVQDTGNPFVFTRIFEWINLSFVGLMPILQFAVLPGISVGAVLLVPFVITLLLFIVKLFKR